MEEQLISLETAKLAKEKGFNIPIYYHYSENPINDLILLAEPDDPQSGQGWVLENYNKKGYIFNKWSAPTQSLLQKWLRDNYTIHIAIYPLVNKGWCGDIREFNGSFYITNISNEFEAYNTYEQALEEGLQEALKLINTDGK